MFKNKITYFIQLSKIIMILLSCFCLIFNQTYAIVYQYNNASIESNIFNNGLPIPTGNSAGVEIKSEASYSGDTVVSDNFYNIASLGTTSFNNGLPIFSGKQAKVIVDKSISTGSGDVIGNDSVYNIASLNTSSFNNGLPITSGKQAKVTLDKTLLTGSGESINNDMFYNIASLNTSSFNNGLPITSGKQAKVTLDKTLLTGSGFLITNETYFNIASFTSSSFNNGLPITSGKQAQVTVKPLVNEWDKEVIENINKTWTDSNIIFPVIQSGSLIDITETSISGSVSKIFTNSTNFIYQGRVSDPSINIKILESYDSSKNMDYSKIHKGPKLIYGDNGIYQKIIKTKRENVDKLKIGDKLKITSVYNTKYTQNKEVTITGTILPPVLTYPFRSETLSGTYVKYISNSQYPIIKGMAFPNSIIRLDVEKSGLLDKYFIKVDKDGLFNAEITKKLDNGEYKFIFQYEMMDDNNNTVYTKEKLKNPIGYNIVINDSLKYITPEITSIYNDDEIHSNVFYMKGYANTGEKLNYKLSRIDNGNLIDVVTGDTVVNSSNKRFEFLLGDREIELKNGDYVVDLWQNNGLHERKAFTLKGNNNDNIGILNFNDFSISPTLKPSFIGYSKENNINKDTIRVSVCDITNDSNPNIPLIECPNNKKRIIGTTNADKNGIFIFNTIEKLVNNRFYQFEFYNTKNLYINKKIILKTDTNYSSSLSQSQILSVINGISIDSNMLLLDGFTNPGANIKISNSNGAVIKNIVPEESGYFSSEVKIPSDGLFNVEYSKSGELYKTDYKLIINKNKTINNTDSNYYQNFSKHKGASLIEIK